MESAKLVVDKMIEISEGRIFLDLGEKEIISKMQNLYFFGVVEFTDRADDIPSDDRVMIHYYFSVEEYEPEISHFEKRLCQALKVTNKWPFDKQNFHGGFKKPIGYQIDPTNLLWDNM